jgi:hypothetical protein
LGLRSGTSVESRDDVVAERRGGGYRRVDWHLDANLFSVDLMELSYV